MKSQKYLNIKNFHNPIGTYQNNLIINNFMKRYDQFISKNITIKAFKDKSSYVFKLKIPSEKNFKYKTNIYYDVIVEFSPLNSKMEKDKKIIDYKLRVFTNNPSFMFIFTNVYSKIDALYKKIPITMYSKLALKQQPKETNPNKLLGLDKTLFYSFRKIYETTFYNKSKIDKIVVKLPEDDPSFIFPGNLFEDIKSQNAKLEELRNVDVIKLKKVRKKKASDRTSNLVIGGKKVATEEYRQKSNNLQKAFDANLHNAKIIQENEKLKSSLSKSNLKSKGFKK